MGERTGSFHFSQRRDGDGSFSGDLRSMSEVAASLDAHGPWTTLDSLRLQSPLVQNITNFVAMDLAANLLLAVGASPAMVQAREEVEEFVALADALTINLGTLTAPLVEAMAGAAREAVAQGKPWVLDPVGAGTTSLRDDAAKRLVRLQPTVIRGNGSEILALGGGERSHGRGAESTVDSVEALDAAHDLAKRSGSVVAVTGAIDYVTDGRRMMAVANGHPMMGRVTAVGCALTCLIGACCAVEPDPLIATADALAILGVAGEIAGADAAGPGSFRVHLIDALYGLDQASLQALARVQ